MKEATTLTSGTRRSAAAPQARPWIAAALIALAPGAALAQTAAAPMSDPSADDLRRAWTTPSGTEDRAFRPTALPSTEGRCPGAEGGGTGSLSASRNLEVVPYGAPAAPHADLGVQFANESDMLTPAGRHLLDRVAEVMRMPDFAAVRFAVAGHTDATGPDRLNRELSCARAIAVRAYLTQHGVAAQRLGAYGFGSSRPLEPDAIRSAVNRRVEIRRVD